MKKAISIMLIIVLIFCTNIICLAHSGRTDARGGHYDRSTGDYHYHNGEYAGREQSSSNNKTDSSTSKRNEYKIKDFYPFFWIFGTISTLYILFSIIMFRKKECDFKTILRNNLIIFGNVISVISLFGFVFGILGYSHILIAIAVLTLIDSVLQVKIGGQNSFIVEIIEIVLGLLFANAISLPYKISIAYCLCGGTFITWLFGVVVAMISAIKIKKENKEISNYSNLFPAPDEVIKSDVFNSALADFYIALEKLKKNKEKNFYSISGETENNHKSEIKEKAILEFNKLLATIKDYNIEFDEDWVMQLDKSQINELTNLIETMNMTLEVFENIIIDKNLQ